MQMITYKPIGIIRTPFKKAQGAPIQSAAADAVGHIELSPEYLEGLSDLSGFSHIILFYHFHRSKPYSLKVKPFLDKNFRGVFATRAPSRPNSCEETLVSSCREVASPLCASLPWRQ